MSNNLFFTNDECILLQNSLDRSLKTSFIQLIFLKLKRYNFKKLIT